MKLEINKNKVKNNKDQINKLDFIEKQKMKLEELRLQLTGRISENTKSVIKQAGENEGMTTFGTHQGDAGSDTYDCDFALNLLIKENNAVKEIDDALNRIKNKTYGICIDSGEEIPIPRLEALPYAKRTVKCQQKFEENNINIGSSLAPISSLFQQADVSYDIVKQKKKSEENEENLA